VPDNDNGRVSGASCGSTGAGGLHDMRELGKTCLSVSREMVT